MGKNILNFIVFISFVSLLVSCSSKDHKITTDPQINDTNTEETNSVEESTEPEDENYERELFGITVTNDEADALRKLQAGGILTIDTLALNEEGKFKHAIVEFASVKFGVNRGLVFLTSRSDKKAI